MAEADADDGDAEFHIEGDGLPAGEDIPEGFFNVCVQRDDIQAIVYSSDSEEEQAFLLRRKLKSLQNRALLMMRRRRRMKGMSRTRVSVSRGDDCSLLGREPLQQAMAVVWLRIRPHLKDHLMRRLQVLSDSICQLQLVVTD